MIHPTFSSWNLQNRRVFLRADLNVPLSDGNIRNDFRLTSILPTIDYILNKQGSIVLATHIGRPKNQEPELSTQLLIPWFKQRGYTIQFVQNISTIATMKIIPQQILLLENLRFFPGEKNGDIVFAQELARTAQYYINDAFGTIHEHECSTTLLPYDFSENRRSIGLLMKKELQAFDALTENSAHPFLAILGGGKIKDKIPLISSLLHKVDTVALYPAICFSFLKALGKPVGKSLVDDTILDTCKKIILEAEFANVSYLFPVDYQITYNVSSLDSPLILSLSKDADNFPDNAIGISVGPKTVELISKEINRAKTVFLNCAMGFSECPATQQSTRDIIEAMTQSSAKTIIAGGDSVDIALQTEHYQNITHLSTGGGAALAYLSNKLLPGLIPFEESFRSP
jgi:phosphoglycerate kinase